MKNVLVADQILDYMSGWFTIIRANRKVSQSWLSKRDSTKAMTLEDIKSQFEEVKSFLKK